MQNFTPTVLRIGRYEILGYLGAGSMGVVHLAKSDSKAECVVLKTLGPTITDRVLVGMLKREAKAMNALDHPNIPAYYDIDQDDKIPRDLTMLHGWVPIGKLSDRTQLGVTTEDRTAGASPWTTCLASAA